MNGNAKYWVGLAASVLTAAGAASYLLPEPWNHVMLFLAALGAGASGYMIQHKNGGGAPPPAPPPPL